MYVCVYVCHWVWSGTTIILYTYHEQVVDAGLKIITIIIIIIIIIIIMPITVICFYIPPFQLHICVKMVFNSNGSKSRHS
jgi:hypothetical protein